MMNQLTLALFVCVLLALWTVTEGARGLNPCHRGRSFDKVATLCDSIVIPPTLCRGCRIRAVDPDGFFPDCERIYRLDDTCQSGIGEYVDLNPCDTKRKEQFENIGVPENRRFLDFFIYAVCEECCDCVPFGAKPDEYSERKDRGRFALTQLRRGNCPVHARFDICSIWPRVRDIVPPGRTPRLGRPRICPIIEEWFQSDLSNGWAQNPNVTMNFQMTRFLRRFNWVARCRSKKIWEECAALEFAQGRI